MPGKHETTLAESARARTCENCLYPLEFGVIFTSLLHYSHMVDDRLSAAGCTPLESTRDCQVDPVDTRGEQSLGLARASTGLGAEN
jgi:hypothetical protein